LLLDYYSTLFASYGGHIPGYPLASLQLANGATYISELGDRDEEELWQRVLGKPLHDLVAAALGRPLVS
jgi:hypothetical protein